MTGCSALGLLPVACASARCSSSKQAWLGGLVSGQGRGGLAGAAWLLSDKLPAPVDPTYSKGLRHVGVPPAPGRGAGKHFLYKMLRTVLAFRKTNPARHYSMICHNI